MKLTWFGKTCLRLHAGGAIVVFDPDAASPGFDRGELVAGADLVVPSLDALPEADGRTFRPGRPCGSSRRRTSRGRPNSGAWGRARPSSMPMGSVR